MPLHAHETVTALKIVDGDTLKVIYEGQKESIRLIGIATPEPKVNAKAKRDAKRTGQGARAIVGLDKKATASTRNLVKSGDAVRIEFDVQTTHRWLSIVGRSFYGPEQRIAPLD